MKVKLMALIYAMAAIISFGHAWNNGDWDNHGQQLMGAPACGLFWPLYVSAQAWN